MTTKFKYTVNKHPPNFTSMHKYKYTYVEKEKEKIENISSLCIFHLWCACVGLLLYISSIKMIEAMLRHLPHTELWHSITLTQEMSNCVFGVGKPREKRWLPQGDHRSVTHVLSDIWLIGSDGYSSVDTVTLYPECYRCQMFRLDLRHLS